MSSYYNNAPEDVNKVFVFVLNVLALSTLRMLCANIYYMLIWSHLRSEGVVKPPSGLLAVEILETAKISSPKSHQIQNGCF